MADEKGRWFKCYTSLQDSEVWDDLQALRCWLWCMQNVNWKDQKTFGKTFPRGSFWCNVRDAAKACRCSTNSWTAAMRKLVGFGMITMTASPKYTTIKVVNWDRFQGGSNDASVSKIETRTETHTETVVETRTDTQPETRSRSPRTSSNVEGSGAAADAAPPAPRQRFVPPTIQEAAEYARQVVPFAFSVAKWHEYYTSNGWKVGRNPMKDWKAALRRWAREDRERNAKQAKTSAYDRPDAPPSVIPGMERHMPTNQRRLIGE